jgi:hypothetical protein
MLLNTPKLNAAMLYVHRVDMDIKSIISVSPSKSVVRLSILHCSVRLGNMNAAVTSLITDSTSCGHSTRTTKTRFVIVIVFVFLDTFIPALVSAFLRMIDSSCLRRRKLQFIG